MKFWASYNYKDDKESDQEMEKVIEQIAQQSKNNCNKIKEALTQIKPEKGPVNSKQMWKLGKKLFPRSREPSSAMLDEKGNILTSDKAIKERALEVFAKRLEPNKIEPHLKRLEEDTNTLCEVRLKIAKQNKTEPWTMEDLKFALKQLEDEKS